MVGSVFYQEVLLGSRRGRHHVLRRLFAGWLVLQFGVFFLLYRMEHALASQTVRSSYRVGAYDPNVTSRFVSSYLDLLVTQQLIVMVLATPAFAAGAITDEKTSGTLQYLLTTGLRTHEIIWGKLLGRLAQVALLGFAGLPFLWFFGGFAGWDPGLLLLILAVPMPPAFGCAAASLLASVWCCRTRDAVLRLYALGGAVVLVAWGFHEWLFELKTTTPANSWLSPVLMVMSWLDYGIQFCNPFFVLKPIWEGEGFGAGTARLFCSLLAWGSFGAGCLALATARLRPAYRRQLENAGKPKKPRWYRPSRPAVGNEPVRWKERYVEGMAFLHVLRQVPRYLGVVMIFLGTLVVGLAILLAHLRSPHTLAEVSHLVWTFDVQGLGAAIQGLDDPSESFLAMALLVLFLASLIAGIRCSGTVSGERERQTWEALLLTPLETREIIRGKLWGILGSISLYLLAYAVAALPLAALGGVVSLFLVLLLWVAAWLAMYFMGAAGIWSSVRSKSSWRSLLGTLGISYVGGTIIFVLFTPIIGIVALFVMIILIVVDQTFQTGLGPNIAAGFMVFGASFYIAACLVLAFVFWGLAWYFIADAQKWVADRERTRHWKNEYRYRAPRLRRREKPS
jgi:ABC-type transport system involved in multi-copper enzyme maturation permease subunit